MSRRMCAVLAVVVVTSTMVHGGVQRHRKHAAHGDGGLAVIRPGGPGYRLHLGPGAASAPAVQDPCAAPAPERDCQPARVEAPVKLDPRTDVYVEAPCAPHRDPCAHPHAIAGRPRAACVVHTESAGPNTDGTLYEHPSFPGRPLYWNSRQRQWGYRDDRSPTGWFVVPLEANVPPVDLKD